MDGLLRPEEISSAEAHPAEPPRGKTAYRRQPINWRGKVTNTLKKSGDQATLAQDSLSRSTKITGPVGEIKPVLKGLENSSARVLPLSWTISKWVKSITWIFICIIFRIKVLSDFFLFIYFLLFGNLQCNFNITDLVFICLFLFIASSFIFILKKLSSF